MLSWLSEQPKLLVCGAVTSDSSCQVVPPEHQLEVCVDLVWRTVNDELPSEVQQAQIGAVKQRNGEVIVTKLDVDQRKNLRDTMTCERQSWLRYPAVKAALCTRFAEKDVMKMRRVLRFKDTGLDEARLVIVGYRDPRIRVEVRTEAPVLGRKGRSLHLTNVAQYRRKQEGRQERFLERRWSRRGAGA